MAHKVFLNPGHDRFKDPGATGHGLREADVVWEVGVDLMEELTRRGYEVSMAQNDDLDRVCREANKFQANLFVSLHCDAHTSGEANGTTAYWFGDSAASKAGNAIRDNICEELGTANRHYLHSCNFYVCRYTAMPATLIEMFFITNKSDVERYQSHKQGLCKAIADGIDKYFKE